MLQLKVAILVGQGPELIAVHHRQGIFSLLLSQDNTHAVVALARGNIQMATHRTALTGIKVVLEPLVGPLCHLLCPLVTGTGHRILTVGRADKERTVEFLLALIQHHSLSAKVFTLQHLDGDGRLTGGMDGEFLTLASAIDPFVAHGDIIEAIVGIVTQAVQGIALNIVGPVIFCIDTTIAQIIGSILNRILFLFGSSHLAIRGDTSVHAPVHVAIQHIVAQAGTDTCLLDWLAGRSRSTRSNDIRIKAGHTFTHDKSLFKNGVAGGGTIEHLTMFSSILDNSHLRGTKTFVALGCGIVEIDTIVRQELRSLALQGTDTSVAVNGKTPCAVRHLGCHAADCHCHITIGSHSTQRQKKSR